MKILYLPSAVRECRLCNFGAAWLFALWMGASLAPNARAEDARLFQVEARFVRISEAQARKAFGEKGFSSAIGGISTADQTARTLRILSQVKADFFSNPSVVAKSGQKAKVETVRELRYPTEFNPSKDEPGRFVPTAFETRNVGVTLEVEGIIQDDYIDLRIAPKIVNFLGFIDYAGHKGTGLASGLHPMAELLKRRLTEGGIWQPVFSSQEVTTNVRLTSGLTILVGGLPLDPAMKDVDVGSPRTVIFITARILPTTGAASPLLPTSP
jgi:Flp pilus assembly secretin CpaC